MFLCVQGIALAVACGDVPAEREPAPPPRAPSPAADRVAVRAGAREVRVRCALACEDARSEMTRLREDCVADPTSTPRSVSADPALVALGCCTDALTSYRRACGVDADLAACASRWVAECERGRSGS